MAPNCSSILYSDTSADKLSTANCADKRIAWLSEYSELRG